MKKQLKQWSLVALGVCGVLLPQKAYGFSGGIGGITPDVCNVFKAIDHPDNEIVTVTVGNKTGKFPLMVKFNETCSKTRELDYAMEHINGTNGESNILFLTWVGDVMAYTPVPGEYAYVLPKGTRKGLMADIGKRGQNKYSTFSVAANNTMCGLGVTSNTSKCIKGYNYFLEGSSLKDSSGVSDKQLAIYKANNDIKKIEAVTGEYKYMGYSAEGAVITNPYYPSEYPWAAKGTDGWLKDYPFSVNPWDVKIGGVYYAAKTEYDSAEKFSDKYAIKYDTTKRLIKAEGLGSTSDKNVKEWMKRLSLKNDGTLGAASFAGTSNGTPKAKPGTSGKWGKWFWAGAHLGSPEEADRNAAIMDVKITEVKPAKDTYFGWYERYEPGYSYGKAHGSKPANQVLEGGKEYRIEIVVENDSAGPISQGSHLAHVEIDLNDQPVLTETPLELDVKGSGGYNNNKRVLTGTFVAPYVDGHIELDVSLDDKTYEKNNFRFVDDDAQVEVEVKSPSGDLSVCDIELVSKGTRTPLDPRNMVENREYDVLYRVCYNGPDLKGPLKLDFEGELSTYEGTAKQTARIDDETNVKHLNDGDVFEIRRTI